MAAVVCGPGSILTSSQVGAKLGYSAVWVVVLACALMVAMVLLAMRLGVTCQHTPCQEIADRLGRPVAVLLGVVMFLIIACFQSSNNLAVAASLEAFGAEGRRWVSVALIVAINAIVMSFLYLGQQQYRWIERAMKFLVALMVIAFALNCIVARPSLTAAAGGLVPRLPEENVWLLVALIGTTFSVAAAFYQAYLVREKNWTLGDVQTGASDALVGVVSLGLISLVIMMTTAALFYGRPEMPDLNSAADVANQLKPLFGSWAQAIFAIGIFAGAISSFLVNALIGGHILADGCGLGDRIESPWTRHLTTCALLLGMLVALVSLTTGLSRVALIIFAQGLTVVGVPALALCLIYLGWVQRKEKPGSIPAGLLWGAGMGGLVTCLVACRTVGIIWDKIQGGALG